MADGTITVFGKVTTEVETGEMQNGNGVKTARFSLPFGNAGKDENGNYKKTNTWVRATAYGKVAEYITSKLKKGMNVVVIGRPNFSAYPRKTDGELMVAVNVSVSSVNIIYDNAYNDSQGQNDTGGYTSQPRNEEQRTMTGQQNETKVVF